jgi:hypothetical protein
MKGSSGLVVALLFLTSVAAADAVPAGSTNYSGRLLTDVLRDLQAQRLNIVFSSELVTPEMRVESEPKSTAPRKILDEVLSQHGLAVRSGPGGALLVVRARRSPSPPSGRSRSTGAIAGKVVDARTATPLPGVVIAIPELKRQTTSNADGSFAFADVPEGSVALYVSLVGYGLARPTVEVTDHATTEITIPLADGTGTYIEAVTVVGDPFRGTSSNVAAQQALNSAEIGGLRGVLTDDPFRAIQSLPSVSTGNDYRSEFSIRGTDFRHIGLSIDGVSVPWPVHAIRDTQTTGSIAMVSSDIISGVVVSPGAAPQQQPGRLGAWVDLSIREGSRARTEAHGTVSATSASIVTEGALGDSKRGSWLVSMRQGYPQWLLEWLGYDRTTFGFTDVQSKIVFDVTPRQQFQLTTIAGYSRFDQSEQHPGPRYVELGTGSGAIVVAGWRSTIGSSLVFTQRLVALGNRFENQGATTELGRDVATELSYRADAAWTPRPSLMLQLGTYVQRQRETLTTTSFLETRAGTSQAQRTDAVDGTAWLRSGDARAVWTAPGGLSLDGGVRVAYSTLTDQTMAIPWVLTTLPINRSWSLRAGGALAEQVPDFDQVVGTFGKSDARAERARHLDLALEHRPSANVRWQIALYDRHERDIMRFEDSETRTVGNRLTFASSLEPSWQNALSGSARGVELILQRRDAARLSGWVGYSYGRLRYDDAARGESFWSDFDQRHTFTGYGQFRLSPQTSLAAKARLGSNVPVAGYFEERPSGLFVGGARNTVRLPEYARLDVRADRAFNYSHRRLTLFLEVVNVFNRTNVAPANGVVSATGRALEFTNTMFPLLPSAGLRFDF